jgi:hypothetical protein
MNGAVMRKVRCLLPYINKPKGWLILDDAGVFIGQVWYDPTNDAGLRWQWIACGMADPGLWGYARNCKLAIEDLQRSCKGWR